MRKSKKTYPIRIDPWIKESFIPKTYNQRFACEQNRIAYNNNKKKEKKNKPQKVYDLSEFIRKNSFSTKQTDLNLIPKEIDVSILRLGLVCLLGGVFYYITYRYW
jgi:hypothetical protein